MAKLRIYFEESKKESMSFLNCIKLGLCM
jgi:hypothetical protein